MDCFVASFLAMTSNVPFVAGQVGPGFRFAHPGYACYLWLWVPAFAGTTLWGPRKARRGWSPTAKARNRASNDLHGHANDPSRHDHCRPGDVRIVAEHDHGHGSKSRTRREKRAHRAQKFRGVDLLFRVAV